MFATQGAHHVAFNPFLIVFFTFIHYAFNSTLLSIFAGYNSFFCRKLLCKVCRNDHACD